MTPSEMPASAPASDDTCLGMPFWTHVWTAEWGDQVGRHALVAALELGLVNLSFPLHLPAVFTKLLRRRAIADTDTTAPLGVDAKTHRANPVR